LFWLSFGSISPPILVVPCFLIFYPIGFGYLFKDEERDNALGKKKFGIAWCKGIFLIIFIGIFGSPLLIIIRCLTF
jgi:hypothetical protein